MDYNPLFNMCSDALNNGKMWLAHESLKVFIKYPLIAVPFAAVIVINIKKAIVKLIEALI